MDFKMVHEDARQWSLQITESDVEGGPDHLTLWLDHEEAVALFMAVEEGIGAWVADYRHHEALYKASKHLHEDEFDPGEGYEPDDPKRDRGESLAEWADQMRKSERENR